MRKGVTQGRRIYILMNKLYPKATPKKLEVILASNNKQGVLIKAEEPKDKERKDC